MINSRLATIHALASAITFDSARPFDAIPINGKKYRKRANSRVGLPQPVVSVAAPAILSGGLHHHGADGVEFDIAHAGEQVAFCLDHAGFVTTFPQTAGAAVTAIDVLHVTSADGLQELGDSRLAFWRDHQMYMVGHEHIGVDVAVPIGSYFFQPEEVKVVILLGKKKQDSRLIPR